MNEISYLEFKDFIYEVDSYFKPKLSEKVDLQEFTLKVYNKGSIYFVKEENKVVAVICGYHNDFIDKKAYVSVLAVLDGYRNKGYASKLLNEFETNAKNKGMNLILLKTGLNNSARFMYEKKGFKIYDKDQISYYLSKNI